MSGVTCQFCGKPLWRIRRGSEGDFCSRDHRNRYKLRMGLSQLAEAEKVSSVRRRCEGCNITALGRASGSPDLQKRRPSSFSITKTARALSLVASGRSRKPDEPCLRDTATVVRVTARRPKGAAIGMGAAAFSPPVALARAGHPLPAALPGGAGAVAGRALRVPLAEGALSGPVFLIARFAQRHPAVPQIEGHPVARVTGADPVAVSCRPRSAPEPLPRSAATAFLMAPPCFGETAKPDDLADMACVPYALMPYRVLDIQSETRGPDQRHIAPPVAAAGAALERNGPGAAAISRAAARMKTRELEPRRQDALRERRCLRVPPDPAPPPALPENRAGTRGSGPVELRFCGVRVAPGSGAPPQVRAAAVARRGRAVGRGRRAAWSGRARLPGFSPRPVWGAPAGAAGVVRPAAVAYRRAASPAAVPPSAGAAAMPVAGPRRLAAGLRGPARTRALELPPPGRELLIAPFRPGLRGVLTDPMPGSETFVIEEHFAKGLELWAGDTAGWKLDIAGVRPAAPALFSPSLGLADYRLEFLARVERGSLTCLFRAAAIEDCHAIRIGSGGGSLERYTLTGGAADSRASAALTGIPAGKSLNVQLDVRGGNFTVAVNGRAIDRWSDSRLPSGGVGFGSNPEDRVRLYWVKLTYRTPENSESETSPL